MRRIERKAPRRHFRDRRVGVIYASEPIAIDMLLFLINIIDVDGAVRQINPLFHGFGQSAADIFGSGDTIHHYLDSVGVILIQGGKLFHIIGDAINPHPGKSGLLQLFRHMSEFAFPVHDHRRQK
jgi:hypothetical protein